MKKIGIMIMLLLLSANISTAGEKWTGTDLALEGAFLTSLAMDAAQTLHISRNPETRSEWNPLLGEHPSRAKVVAYFSACAALHVVMANHLEGGWRTSWQVFWLGTEIQTVQYNRRDKGRPGIGISLHF